MPRVVARGRAVYRGLLLGRFLLGFGGALAGALLRLTVLGFGATAFVRCAAVGSRLASVRGVVRWRRRWAELPPGVSLIARRRLAVPGIRMSGRSASTGS